MKAELLEQTLANGIEPFTLLFLPVRRCLSAEAFGYRTARRVNSMNLGMLTPDRYRNVCERTQQCVRLAKSDIAATAAQILRMHLDPIGFEWLSVHIPAKFLLSETAADDLEEIFTSQKFDTPKKLLLEIDSAVLYEDIDAVAKAMFALKRLEVRLALTEFGDDFCPVNRLSGLPVSYVFLTPNDKMTGKGLTALTSMAHINETSVIADIKRGADRDTLNVAGCAGYIERDVEWLEYSGILPKAEGGDAE